MCDRRSQVIVHVIEAKRARVSLRIETTPGPDKNRSAPRASRRQKISKRVADDDGVFRPYACLGHRPLKQPGPRLPAVATVLGHVRAEIDTGNSPA